MLDSKNGGPPTAYTHINGDSSKVSIKSHPARDNYLAVLERQIEGLQANHSR